MALAHVDRDEAAPDGSHGARLVLELTDTERRAIQGPLADAPNEMVWQMRLSDLLHVLHGAARGAAALRSIRTRGSYAADPADDPELLRGLIVALERDLIPALEGIRDGAVRAHADAGGSHAQLAEAMGVARSTAQSRLEALQERGPSAHEQWATGASQGGLRAHAADPAQ